MSFAHGGWSEMFISTTSAFIVDIEVPLLVSADFTPSTPETTLADGTRLPGLTTYEFEAFTNDVDDTNNWLTTINSGVPIFVNLTALDGLGTVTLGSNGTTGAGAYLIAEFIPQVSRDEKHQYRIYGTFVGFTPANVMTASL